jgi:outer membrane protein
MKKKLACLLICIVTVTLASAQNDVLDEYIRQGIANNYELELQRINYNKSLSTWREARGMFMPGISVNARYTVAEGGRTIALPIRDIFGGYSMANNIANPNITLITPEQITNEQINFLRPTEQETKITLAQPLFNTDIIYNARIRNKMAEANEIAIRLSSRKLVADIREAYFNYLKAAEVSEWLEEAKALSREFIRVNERLMENDQITADALYRARAEDSKVDQQMAEARQQKQVAASYFNYLTGRPEGSTIMINDTVSVIPSFSSLDEVVTSSMANREELIQLDILNEAADDNVQRNSLGKLPTLAAVADYGFQGEKYRFTGDYDYLLASVVLRWDLFGGLQKKEKLHQALLDKQSMETNKLDTRRKIEIEVSKGWYGLQAAEAAMQTSVLEEDAMHKAFDIIRRKYENGQASVLEYTDARTQWSQSVMNRIIQKYDYYIDWYNLLRISASEEIDHYINEIP